MEPQAAKRTKLCCKGHPTNSVGGNVSSTWHAKPQLNGDSIRQIHARVARDSPQYAVCYAVRMLCIEIGIHTPHKIAMVSYYEILLNPAFQACSRLSAVHLTQGVPPVTHALDGRRLLLVVHTLVGGSKSAIGKKNQRTKRT